jgi:hypothetical protein
MIKSVLQHCDSACLAAVTVLPRWTFRTVRPKAFLQTTARGASYVPEGRTVANFDRANAPAERVSRCSFDDREQGHRQLVLLDSVGEVRQVGAVGSKHVGRRRMWHPVAAGFPKVGNPGGKHSK